MIDRRLLIVVGLILGGALGDTGPTIQPHNQKLSYLASSPAKEASSEADGAVPKPSAPTKRMHKRRKGRLSINLYGNTMHILPSDDPLDIAGNFFEDQSDEVSLTIGPTSAIRLAKIALAVSGTFFGAFMGTLRLLAPLILARRVINTAGELVYDYMRGRYIRTTYTKMENLYIRYYELPAVFRAISRTVAQALILFILSFVTSRNISLLPGARSPFDPPGCWWSGVICILLTVGGGNLSASALSVWGGPLRIQVNASHQSSRNLSRVFTRPWHILQWMKDPEEWITSIASPPAIQPFAADPILFPATWAPLRLLQILGVAQALSRPNVMRLFLLQVAFADEWYRTLVSERRVTLGLCVALCYLVSTLSLILTIAAADIGSSIFLVPHLLAVVVSSWMNLIIFWNRLEEKRRDATLEALREHRQAAWRAIIRYR